MRFLRRVGVTLSPGSYAEFEEGADVPVGRIPPAVLADLVARGAVEAPPKPKPKRKPRKRAPKPALE
jgi:hypothetical protein